jgi:hypothetical protein
MAVWTKNSKLPFQKNLPQNLSPLLQLFLMKVLLTPARALLIPMLYKISELLPYVLCAEIFRKDLFLLENLPS